MRSAACRVRLIAVLGGLLLVVAGHAAEIAVRDFSVTTSRSFGFFIGDIITRIILLELEPPFVLMQDQLPRTGRIDHWLELRAVDVNADQSTSGNRYRIALQYQIVNLEADIRKLTLPAPTVYYRDSSGRFSLPIQGQTITVASLSDPDRPASELRPDRLPPPIPLHTVRLLLLAALLLAALLGLAYLHRLPPFRARHRAFADAGRKLRTLPTQAWDEARQREAALLLHRAFDQTYGSALFRRDIDRFLQVCPAFLPLQTAIEAFFEASQDLFFQTRSVAKERLSADTLLALCRACHQAEKRL